MLVTFKGIWGSSTTTPVDEWQFTLRFGVIGTGTVSDADMNTRAAAGATAWSGNLAVVHRPHVQLTNVVHAIVGTDGKWERDPDGSYSKGEWTGATAGTGSGSTNTYPPQVAVVASLMTTTAGARGKGRIFLPPPQHGISTTDGRMVTGDAQIIADKVKDFLVALRPTFGNARVFSTFGGSSEVKTVRVGRVLDTHRSRRNAALEGYLTSALPA